MKTKKCIAMALCLTTVFGMTASVNAAEKEELKFWLRDEQDSVIFREMSALVEEYNAKEDGLANVTIEAISASDYITKYNAAFASGTAPDIIEGGVDMIALNTNMGNWLPMEDYIANWDDKDNILEKNLTIGELEDGHTYCVAYSPVPAVFVWRKDFFEEAGLDPDTPPATWDELLEYAEKLTVYEDDTVVRGGFTIDVGNHMMFTILARQAGSVLYDSEEGRLDFVEGGGIDELEFIQALQPYSMVYTDNSTSQSPFYTSETAMSYLNADGLIDVLDKNPELAANLGYAACVPMTEDSAESTWCGYHVLAINSGCNDPDAAWDFISYLMSEDVNRILMENANVIPAWENLLDEYKAQGELEEVKAEAVLIGEPYLKVEWAGTWAEAVNVAQQEVMQGAKTPEEAMIDAEEFIILEAGLE